MQGNGAATTVLLIDDGSSVANAVVAALNNDDFSVVRVGGLPNVQNLSVLDTAEAVLFPGSLPPASAECFHRWAAMATAQPPVIVYTDDPGTVPSFQLIGLDVMVAPFASGYLKRLVGNGIRGSQHGDVYAQMVRRVNRYEHELRIGREIQKGFLPSMPLVPEGWEIDAELRPATNISGDFYDVFPVLDGRCLAFVVADVSEKGVGAGLFMALIRTLIRRLAQQGGSRTAVHQVLEHINEDHPSRRGEWIAGLLAAGEAQLLESVKSTNDYLTSNHAEQSYFATMFFGALNPASGSLAYVNAGHVSGVLRRAGGQLELLPATGPAVGLLADARFSVDQVTLQVGDTLFLCTDGVAEAKSVDGTFLGEAAIHQLLAESAPDIRSLFARVLALVDSHVGQVEPFDDITLMALRRTHPRNGSLSARSSVA